MGATSVSIPNFGFRGRGPTELEGFAFIGGGGDAVFCGLEPGNRAIKLGAMPVVLGVLSKDNFYALGNGMLIVPGIEQYLEFSGPEEAILGMVAYFRFVKILCEML